jgi:prevent-host-death family protein
MQFTMLLNKGCNMYAIAYNNNGLIHHGTEVKGMQETNVVELRKRIKHYIDTVESGEVVRVYRNGKPVAEIVPISKQDRSWKREMPRLTIRGLSLSREILRDRAEAEA